MGALVGTLFAEIVAISVGVAEGVEFIIVGSFVGLFVNTIGILVALFVSTVGILVGLFITAVGSLVGLRNGVTLGVIVCDVALDVTK